MCADHTPPHSDANWIVVLFFWISFRQRLLAGKRFRVPRLESTSLLFYKALFVGQNRAIQEATTVFSLYKLRP